MTDKATTVDQVIRDRQTTKVFSSMPFHANTDRALVDELIASAGWAPFHRFAAPERVERSGLPSGVPWRFYAIDAANSRCLREIVVARGVNDNIPRMLASCTATILVTWLPNPARTHTELIDVAQPNAGELFEGTEHNMEHIAATAAAIQTLLLAATARGVATFWSSGGVLRRAETFSLLGIPRDEILLGAVYLFPSETADAEIATSKQRDKRGAPSEWSRWITVSSRADD